jgi:S-adenosylmethionine decarboxylase
MRSFFKPDKTKTTLLKRGDFTSLKEIKPKVKTHVAPLRKIHNTGAKVIRILAHRNNK